jgi:hypothetical protein
MQPNAATESVSFFCARCVLELQPASSNLYRVTIEAVADPTPPIPPDLQGRKDRLQARRLDSGGQLAG